MTLPPEDPAVLLLVTDNHHSRLLACKRLKTGRLHLTPLANLKEQWNEELHRRPPSRSGASGRNFENLGHVEDERIHRFAKEIAAWLALELPKHVFERLYLFAAPRVLGALRSEAPAKLRHNWIEHATDLARMTEGELALHPEIAALLPVPKD